MVLGLLALISGSLCKVFLDWDDLKPGAPRRLRGRLLFRALYLAPDFIVLSIGFLLSSRGLQAALEAQGGRTNLGADFEFWFRFLLVAYLIALGVCFLLWFACEKKMRYIPIKQGSREVLDPDGQQTVTVSLDRPMWVQGICGKREGVLTIVCGNLIGLASVFSFITFVSFSFLSGF